MLTMETSSCEEVHNVIW